MKVLIVCGVWPPRVSATALLIDKLLPLLQAQGVEIEGLTTKESFSNPDYYIHNGIKVHRANCVLNAPVTVNGPGDFWYKAKQRVRKYLNVREKTAICKKDVTKGFVSALKRLDPDSYDCVIAVCAYYDAAVALFEYKKKYGIHIPIVLYQVDPLAENTIYKSIDELLQYEQELYRGFDHVFTTPIVRQRKTELKWDLSNVTAINFPMGFSCDNAPVQQTSKEILCVYAGYLYGGLRDASFTLELFSRMKNPDIHLCLVGRGQEELVGKYQNGALKGRLHVLGEKTPEECDKILKEADVLINIGNTDPNLLPSKLLHYLGFGKPILNIVACDNCPSALFVDRYPLARSIKNTGNVMSDTLHSTELWLQDNYTRRVSLDVISRLYEDCTPEYIAKEIVTNLSGGRK